MKILKEINNKESGQAFILVLILLAVGALIIVPLLAFMSTGLIAGQTAAEKMKEVFADDAGIEDAIHNIITPGTLHYDELQELDEGGTPLEYTLTVNGLEVTITITKLYLIQGLLGEDEFPQGKAPHSGWMTFDPPTATPDSEAGWVEYSCLITLTYEPEQGQGQQTRQLESIGAFFALYPGDDMIDPASPDDIVYGPVITDENLESIETKVASGGFAFIWRWEKNQGPNFAKDETGTLSFTFKVLDPDWTYSIYFVWSTYKQQDIAYVTSGEVWKWLIEATAGDTTVRAGIVEETSPTGASILTWEINPPPLEPE